jgi:hypothetical protein
MEMAAATSSTASGSSTLLLAVRAASEANGKLLESPGLMGDPPIPRGESFSYLFLSLLPPHEIAAARVLITIECPFESCCYWEPLPYFAAVPYSGRVSGYMDISGIH